MIGQSLAQHDQVPVPSFRIPAVRALDSMPVATLNAVTGLSNLMAAIRRQSGESGPAENPTAKPQGR